MNAKIYKKILIIVLAGLFIAQPVYGLAPQSPRLDGLAQDAKMMSVAERIAELKTVSRERAGVIQKEVEDMLSNIQSTRRVIPYWETLIFGPDNSFEIVMDYVDTTGRSNVVVNRFKKEENGKYNIVVIPDDARAYNISVRNSLGLNFEKARQVVPAPVWEEVEKSVLPLAVQNRGALKGPDPLTGRLAYLYAATDEDSAKNLLGIVEKAKERIGRPIKAVVVLGIGGQSLGNRAIIEVLGSRDVKFIFPDNMANPNRWIEELKGINPEEVLLYVSSKTGSTDETMANFKFFWDWLVRSKGSPDAVSRLLEKLKAFNFTKNLSDDKDLALTDDEKNLLGKVLNQIVVSTTPEKKGPLYLFAVNNNIPVVALPEPVEGRYTALFNSAQFTTALAGYDVNRMRESISSETKSFANDSSELNPAMEAAMYAYASGRPILTLISSDKRLTPLFEWARQLINESLGKDNKGPYLVFASSEEEANRLLKAPKDKFYVTVNVGNKKLDVPEGVPAIDINLTDITPENLARLLLFFEEFTVRYGTLLGVNPLNQPWVDRFKEILTVKAEDFNASPEAREERASKAGAVNKFNSAGGLTVPERVVSELAKLTEKDEVLKTVIQTPKTSDDFKGLADVGNYKLPGELEDIARNLAVQLYSAEKTGKLVNPFFIYSGTEQARLLGEFIKQLGNARLERLGGGIVWDYLIGTTDQHSTAQFLGAGSDVTVTTFIDFIQDVGGKESPVITANGLIHKRLDGKTPKEVNTLYLQAVREALSNEGRITNTLEVPNENEENVSKLYILVSRVSELYSRLKEEENKAGVRMRDLVNNNESVIIKADGSVRVGEYAKEELQIPIDLDSLSIPMSISGVLGKSFVHPQSVSISEETSKGLELFTKRIKVLAATVNNIANKQGSALYQLEHGRDLKEEPRPEFYAFRLEDVIAKVEIGDVVGDTLWEEIQVTVANTMIAKTIKEIKRINPKAKVIVYSDNKQLNERRIKAALDAIDSADVFDVIIQGKPEEVLGDINSRGWTSTFAEASEKTVFASTEKLETVKSVIVPGERFVPFPELATIMQAILRKSDPEGKLPSDVVDSILSNYNVWLELAGFTRDEIAPYIDDLRKWLSSGSNFVVSLPLPPLPKTGSVIQLLDRQYEEIKQTKTFA
jgi:glucose-6-phosphate isomerase